MVLKELNLKSFIKTIEEANQNLSIEYGRKSIIDLIFRILLFYYYAGKGREFRFFPRDQEGLIGYLRENESDFKERIPITVFSLLDRKKINKRNIDEHMSIWIKNLETEFSEVVILLPFIDKDINLPENYINEDLGSEIQLEFWNFKYLKKISN